MSRVFTTIAQGITTTPGNGGTDLFIGGWRVGTYKTQRGIDAAVARHNSPESIADYARKVVARLDTQGLDDVVSGRRRLGWNDDARDAVADLARKVTA